MSAKLQLKPGHSILVVNAPGPPDDLLGPLPEGAFIVAEEPADAVILFVRNLAELRNQVPAAAAMVGRDGLIWVAYPKGGSGVATDVNRDVIRVWVEANTDLRTVAQVAIDPTWSALRLKR
jgi:hypothetical protein